MSICYDSFDIMKKTFHSGKKVPLHIVDGKVGILISKGAYGGWSTWNVDLNYAIDKRLIDKFNEKVGEYEFSKYAISIGYEGWLGGVNGLRLELIDVGLMILIEVDDIGNESIKTDQYSNSEYVKLVPNGVSKTVAKKYESCNKGKSKVDFTKKDIIDEFKGTEYCSDMKFVIESGVKYLKIQNKSIREDEIDSIGSINDEHNPFNPKRGVYYFAMKVYEDGRRYQFLIKHSSRLELFNIRNNLCSKIKVDFARKHCMSNVWE